MQVYSTLSTSLFFSPFYFRVFNGFGTLGTFVTMCILAAEITSQRYRSLVGNLVHILWGPGQMVLALMAYFIRDWRTLHIAVATPSIKKTVLGNIRTCLSVQYLCLCCCTP